MKKKQLAIPEFPKVIETFGNPSWRLSNFRDQQEPSSFNGTVEIRKYRITIELLDEPQEVLAERVRMLWRKCDNHHHWHPLQQAAKQLGITLSEQERGVERAKQYENHK